MTPEKAVEILEKGEENKIAIIKIGIRSLSIKALKKQIPQKPVFDGLYACPNCKTIILKGTFNYCHTCGQALDWSEGKE